MNNNKNIFLNKSKSDLFSVSPSLQIVLNSMDIPFVFINTNFDIVLYNRAFVRLWHLSLRKKYNGNDITKLNYIVSRFKNPRKLKIDLENVLKNKSGKHITDLILIDSAVIRQTSKFIRLKGDGAGILITYEKIPSISKEDKIKNEFENLRRIIGPISLPVFLLDKKDKYRWCNLEFEKLVDSPKEEFINKPSSKINNVRARNIKRTFVEKSINTHKNSFEVFLNFESNTEKGFNMYHSKLNGSKANELGTIVILQDVTELKKIENLLKESEEMFKKSNASKDKFFSILAHDLRNPFGVILGITKLLSENIKDFSMEELRDSLIKLNNSTEHLYNLFENLLDWSRIQRGSISYEPQKLNLKETSAISLFPLILIASEKKISLKNRIRANTFILADKKMFETILRNLVANAIKYSHQNSDIIISSKVFNKNFIEITVKDFGIGIDDSLKKKLFKIEHKTSTPGTEDETGTGLGLILCKEFINIHNSDIWIESRKGKGTEFKFTMQKFH